MATPLAGTDVERGVEVELRKIIENEWASGGCHPCFAERSRYAGETGFRGWGWHRGLLGVLVARQVELGGP